MLDLESYRDESMPKTKWPKKVIVYTDGASRGNPGPASIGIFVTDEKQSEVARFSEALGVQTNNFAEYSAVIMALQQAHHHKIKEMTLRSDSELLIRQLKGEYKVKSETLRPLYEECIALIRKIGKVTFEHVRREFNKEADKLANQALDGF